MSARTPHVNVKQNDRQTACGSMLPSFAFLSVEARSSVALADRRVECMEPSSFGRVSIAYNWNTANTSFQFWNAKPNDALSLSIGMDPEEAPAQEEEEDDEEDFSDNYDESFTSDSESYHEDLLEADLTE